MGVYGSITLKPKVVLKLPCVCKSSIVISYYEVEEIQKSHGLLAQRAKEIFWRGKINPKNSLDIWLNPYWL